MTAALKRGRSSVGMANKFVQSPTLPFPDIPVINQPTLEDEVQRLIQRFNNLETLVERKADNNTLRSAIRISPEAILLEAKDVGVLGTFTVADIIQEQNGTTSGNVPLAITQIKGDVVRTGTILSNNWGAAAGSEYNLNNGTIRLGGSTSPKFNFDGTDLSVSGTITAGSIIAGSVTVDGVALSTISSNAAAGKSLSDTLLTSGTAILKGVIQPQDSGALKVGTITWNPTTGALTGGTGIAITEWGIIGAASGVATFSIQASNGNATFSGQLSAATGSFAGNVSTSGYLQVTGGVLDPIFGASASIVATPSVSGVSGLSANATNNFAVRAYATNFTAVYAQGTGSGSGVSANSASTGVALSASAGLVPFGWGVGIGVAAAGANYGLRAVGSVGIEVSSSSAGGVNVRASNGNMIIGSGVNTGVGNFVLTNGSAGAKLAGQCQILSQDSAGATLHFILGGQNVVAGTGPLAGITNQVRIMVNGSAYYLPIVPI